MSIPRSRRVRWLFLGPQGLRAGWSLLLFALVFALLVAASGFLYSRFLRGSGAPSEVRHGLMVGKGLTGFIVVAASWFMSKVEGRPLGRFGLGGEKRLRRFLLGVLCGFAALTILLMLLRATGHLAFEGRALGAGAALKFGAVYLVGFTFVGLFEEYFMRGYLQFTLARGLAGTLAFLGVKGRAEAIGFWTAALVLSFLFGLSHGSNPGESPVGLLTAGLAGLLFCVSLWYSGSLWWAFGFHLSWDWAQTFFYGTADSGMAAQSHLITTHPAGGALMSGGTTGPEGSLLVLPLLLGLALAIRWAMGPARRWAIGSKK